MWPEALMYVCACACVCVCTRFMPVSLCNNKTSLSRWPRVAVWCKQALGLLSISQQPTLIDSSANKPIEGSLGQGCREILFLIFNLPHLACPNIHRLPREMCFTICKVNVPPLKKTKAFNYKRIKQIIRINKWYKIKAYKISKTKHFRKTYVLIRTECRILIWLTERCLCPPPDTMFASTTEEHFYP